MSSNGDYRVIPIDGSSWVIEDSGARVFLFEGAEKALVVDSGYGKGDLRGVVSGLTKLPPVLVNTHADHDHIGGNGMFEQAFMHPSDFARYREEYAAFHPEASRLPPVAPLWEGDAIDIGGRIFEVILTPGHTPGSIALLDAGNGILLGGDGVIDDRIVFRGPSRDTGAYLASMEKLNSMRVRFHTVYPPHGSFPVGAEILDGLIDGLKRVISGEVEGEPTDFIENGVMFDVGAAIFVF